MTTETETYPWLPTRAARKHCGGVSDRQAEIILAFGKSVQRASKQKGAK